MSSVLNSKGENAHIGSESVNYGVTKRRNKLPTLLAHSGGHHSTERRALVTHSSSLVTPHSVFLFSKGHVVTSYADDVCTIVYINYYMISNLDISDICVMVVG